MLLLLIARLCIDWLAAFKFLTDGNFGDFKAVFKAQIHSYFSLWKHKNKRKQQLSFSKKHMYKGIIIVEYYLYQRKKFTSLKRAFFE